MLRTPSRAETAPSHPEKRRQVGEPFRRRRFSRLAILATEPALSLSNGVLLERSDASRINPLGGRWDCARNEALPACFGASRE
jgi:hypothetical protein